MVGVGRCYFILIVGKYNSNHFSSGAKGSFGKLQIHRNLRGGGVRIIIIIMRITIVISDHYYLWL